MVGKGKGERFLAQSAPRMTWSELREVLAQVVAGLVRVDLEYVPEDIGGGAEEAEREPGGGLRGPQLPWRIWCRRRKSVERRAQRCARRCFR